MSQYTNEMCVLARNIASGIYTKKEAVKKIHELQMQYPGEFDAPGCVKRKEKPWDMEYLKELENLFYHGAPSCAFLEYMAEVADEVYPREANPEDASASLQYFWLCALQHFELFGKL